MSKQDIVRKLTSRKFWVALAGFVSMLLIAIGESESTAKSIAALIMSGASVIGYLVGEGLSDAARNGSDTNIEHYYEGANGEEDA